VTAEGEANIAWLLEEWEEVAVALARRPRLRLVWNAAKAGKEKPK
jgi:hypothetical protein